MRIVEYKATVTQKSCKSMRVQKHSSPFPLGRSRSTTGRRLWGTGWGNRRQCGLEPIELNLKRHPNSKCRSKKRRCSGSIDRFSSRQ